MRVFFTSSHITWDWQNLILQSFCWILIDIPIHNHHNRHVFFSSKLIQIQTGSDADRMKYSAVPLCSCARMFGFSPGRLARPSHHPRSGVKNLVKTRWHVLHIHCIYTAYRVRVCLKQCFENDSEACNARQLDTYRVHRISSSTGLTNSVNKSINGWGSSENGMSWFVSIQGDDQFQFRSGF